jgi:hypothetical protein
LPDAFRLSKSAARWESLASGIATAVIVVTPPAV